MRTRTTWLSAALVSVAMGLACVGAAQSQGTSTTVAQRNFEIVAVEGNKVVVKDEKGTQEITVPSDFRFTVDGKSMAASDLQPGMKGTATITTTTTVKPVTVTEVKNGQVLRASDLSVTVRMADGSTRRFTQGDLDKRDIQVVRDGKLVRTADLRRGDNLSATFITVAAPVVLTEKEVEATLAEAKSDPAPAATAPSAGGTTQIAAAPTAAPAATPAPSVSAAAPAPSAMGVTPEPAPATGMGTMWYVLIGAIVLVMAFLLMRRRKEA
jgi:LPXTG-motif cell wall-anchored protein